jgi:hypothetical protein
VIARFLWCLEFVAGHALRFRGQELRDKTALVKEMAQKTFCQPEHHPK